MLDQSSKILPFLGAIATVTLTAVAQTCLKLGMSNTATAESLNNSKAIIQYSIHVLTNYYIVAGLFGYLLSTLLWLYVLSRLPLSTAYPFVGLSIVLTSLFGVYYLQEPNSLIKVVGVLMVSIGVILVAKG